MRIFEKLLYYWKRNNWMILSPFINTSSITIKHPIFLLGNQGDGITFISRILRRHHKIVSITGNSYYWTGADEMATVMEPVLPQILRLSGRIFNTEPHHETLTPPRSWSYACNDLVKKYHSTEKDIDNVVSRKFNKAIAVALQRFGNSNSRFVDKSQVYTLKTRLIQEILIDNNPYFILFTRNPYVSCYRASMGKAGDLRRYSKFLNFEERFEISLQHWKNAMDTILEDSIYLKNFKIYKFEDFLFDIEVQTKNLCQFLNLDFQEQMLPAEFQKIPFGTKYKMRWYPVNPNVNQKYLSIIEDKYFNQAEEFLGELAAKFGYINPLKLNNETNHPRS